MLVSGLGSGLKTPTVRNAWVRKGWGYEMSRSRVVAVQQRRPGIPFERNQQAYCTTELGWWNALAEIFL